MGTTCGVCKVGETYVDANGNKIVEPVYNGIGGTAIGTIRIVK